MVNKYFEEKSVVLSTLNIMYLIANSLLTGDMFTPYRRLRVDNPLTTSRMMSAESFIEGLTMVQTRIFAVQNLIDHVSWRLT